MNFDKKFAVFLEIAEVLNRHGIVPAIYGSLGLYRLIGQLDQIDDIDIVIPEIYAKEKLPELLKIMQSIGYKQDKTFPHEFFKDKEQIGFELYEELKEFVGVDISHYKTTKVKNAEFRELSLKDYLKFYSKALKEREIKIERTKAKVWAIEKLVKNKKENNFAFVDSQNLNLSIRELGWILDFGRFRKYLFEKYNVSKAFLFIGFIEGNNELYKSLQEAGFVCIFKPTLRYQDGYTKGNCDAELVLQALIECHNYDRAVLVTGDGDFYCLARYLIEKDKLSAVLIPNRRKFSALLRFKICRPFLRFMNDLSNKLEYKKKRPHKDETL